MEVLILQPASYIAFSFLQRYKCEYKSFQSVENFWVIFHYFSFIYGLLHISLIRLKKRDRSFCFLTTDLQWKLAGSGHLVLILMTWSSSGRKNDKWGWRGLNLHLAIIVCKYSIGKKKGKEKEKTQTKSCLLCDEEVEIAEGRTSQISRLTLHGSAATFLLEQSTTVQWVPSIHPIYLPWSPIFAAQALLCKGHTVPKGWKLYLSRLHCERSNTRKTKHPNPLSKTNAHFVFKFKEVQKPAQPRPSNCKDYAKSALYWNDGPRLKPVSGLFLCKKREKKGLKTAEQQWDEGKAII